MKFPVLWLSFDVYERVQGGDMHRMGHRVPFVYRRALLCKTGLNEISNYFNES